MLPAQVSSIHMLDKITSRAVLVTDHWCDAPGKCCTTKQYAVFRRGDNSQLNLRLVLVPNGHVLFFPLYIMLCKTAAE